MEDAHETGANQETSVTDDIGGKGRNVFRRGLLAFDGCGEAWNPIRLELTKWHPYIRSQIDQEKAAMSFAE